MTRLAYSPEEVGALVGRDRRTIIEWIKAGVLPGRVVRRRWVIAAEDVRNLIANGAGSGADISPDPKTPSKSAA